MRHSWWSFFKAVKVLKTLQMQLLNGWYELLGLTYASILKIAAAEKRRKVANHILQAVPFREPRGRRGTVSVVDLDCPHS